MRTWVFIEESLGRPEAIGFELLAKARTLDTDPAVVYLGGGSDEIIAELGAHGAATVYRIVPPEGQLPTGRAAATLASMAGTYEPELLLFGLTPTDRDVAGFLSAQLGLPVISNAVDVVVEGEDVHVINEIFGGTEIVESTFRAAPPHIVIVRPKSFTAEPAPEAKTPTVVDVPLEEAAAAALTGRHVEEHEGPKLEDAAVVVAAGRGLGSADQLQLVERLAELLGGAVGATRAIVDAGWIPYALQVGQTGKTVKPDVYIAAGLSGAMQHLVGMKDSKLIIAINKDEEAPIFGIADLGVVGDVHKVLPQLIEALESRQA